MHEMLQFKFLIWPSFGRLASWLHQTVFLCILPPLYWIGPQSSLLWACQPNPNRNVRHPSVIILK
jgi:hypothetical protein